MRKVSLRLCGQDPCTRLKMVALYCTVECPAGANNSHFPFFRRHGNADAAPAVCSSHRCDVAGASAVACCCIGGAAGLGAPNFGEVRRSQKPCERQI